jgi:predicted HTH transcriptional regulator
MDLADLLRRREGKTLEFKRDLSSPDGILRTLIAFANTAGGVVLIGVEDVTRHVRGVSDPLATEERLANLIDHSIEPRLLPDLDILPWRRTHIVAVQVHPSSSRPHYLRREGEARGTYVRVGSTNRRADAALIEELRRFARAESFDERPVPELSSEALDFRAASESFAPVRVLSRRDFETLRLVTAYQGRKVPTVGGVLLFGRDHADRFPDAWIQVGRFAGTDKARMLDHAELRGYPASAIEQAIAFVREHLRRGAEIGPVRRRERWDLPPVAVREAIINAVTHADYSQRGAPIRVALFDDRLEVESPGLLPFGLTIDDLRRGVSRLRNRVIGRVFHELGLIEQWGSGIQRMTAACREAGLAAPEFEELGFRFRVTLRTARIAAPALAALDQAIVDLLAGGAGRSTAEIASHIERTTRATRARLASLVDRGLLREIGSGPRDPQKRYYRADTDDG